MTARPTPSAQNQKPDAFYAPPAPETRGGRLREFMIGLPVVNRLLLLAGAVAALLGLLGLIARPVLGSVLMVIQPYTASGKQDTCLSKVRSLAQAISMYSSDHDGYFPPMDSGTGVGRRTWVTLLRDRTDKAAFLCPLKGVSDEGTQSSYALNPVLKAGEAVNGEDLQPATIILADRGDEHDVALLPPLPGWRADESSTSTSGAGQAQDLCNLAFNHMGTATVLFADGHAASQQPGAWLQELNTWGGSLAVRQSAAKLKSRHPVLQQVQAALETGDENTGTQMLAGKHDQAQAGLKDALALWKTNNGAGADAEVEKWGWQLARLWSGAGEKGMEQEMNAELSRRSQAELTKVQSGAWEKHLSDDGFFVERPSGWEVETSEDDHYKRTYFRSASPHISIQVEKGVRSTEGPQAPIEWDGMEPGQAAQPANRYKRLQMGTTDLSGETAGLWSFEVERFGEPHLRKLYIGRSHQWDSFIIVCIAPASEWPQWQPIFERMLSKFTYAGE